VRRVRCLRLCLATAGVGVAVAAVALAQDTVPIELHVDARVVPNKAGTAKHPQAVRIESHAYVKIPEGYDPPLVDTVEVWFPKGGLYNGHKYPKCAQNLLARRGVVACPKGSIMGKGRGKATADSVFTYPRIAVVNGGRDTVFFYTVLTNPARVRAPVVGKLTKPGGRWSYKLHTRIPRVLQVVAGIPIVLRELHIKAGDPRKDWIATTSCPRDGRWRYHVLITFTTGQTKTYDGSVRCR
jgi:hypothetical protein